MNFSDFRKLLGADPWNRDADTLIARREHPEFESAAQEAQLFEKKLQGALHVTPPADLLDGIRGIPHRRGTLLPWALAASLAVALGAVLFAWQQSPRWDSVEAYLADHYAHDGARVFASAVNGIDPADIERILARLDASAGPALAGNIRFIKFCPTPDGRGAHMVLDSDQGLVTVIFMPNTSVQDGEAVAFGEMHALLVSLGRGSAAIIGNAGQSIEGLQTLLRRSLITDTTTA